MYGTDSYLDTQGRLHVLYVDTNTGDAHHAIIQNGQVIKDVPVKVPDPYRDRILQDTSGRFYLLGMHKDSSILSIQAGTDSDTDGTHLAPPVSLDLGSKYSMTGWGTFRIAAPRTGTGLANKAIGKRSKQQGISLMFHTGHNTKTTGKRDDLRYPRASGGRRRILLRKVTRCSNIFP